MAFEQLAVSAGRFDSETGWSLIMAARHLYYVEPDLALGVVGQARAWFGKAQVQPTA